MKNRYIIIMLFFSLVLNAQGITAELETSGSRPIKGVYYKDANNVFSKFSGTWKYEDPSNNISFTILLQKVTKWYDIDEDEYIDVMKGEYKYVENGVEIVNTLNNINNNNPYNNNINGSLITNLSLPVAERKIELFFKDPERNYLNHSIVIKYIAANGSAPEKIQIHFIGDMSLLPDETSPDTLRVPVQDYELIKQP